MRGSQAFGVLILAAMLTWAGAGCSEDDPVEGRVVLKIIANDPDGGKLFFNWVQVDGRKVRIADPHAGRFDNVTNKWISETYFIPTEPDKYVFEVTVKNENGLEATKRFSQEVLPPTPPPIANPGADRKTRVGQKIVISGQESKATVKDLTITKYEWTVKRAPEGFELQPDQRTSRQFDFIPKTPGKFVFELKVFDGKHWSDPVALEILVTPKEEIVIGGEDPKPVVLETNRPPAPSAPTRPKAIAALGDNKTQYRVGDTITLDGSQSVVNEALTPRFAWKQLDDDKPNNPRVRTLIADKQRPFSTNRNDKLNYPVQSFVALENGFYKFVLDIQTDENTFTSEPITFQVGNVVPPDPPTPNGNDSKVTPTAAGPNPPVVRIVANKTTVAVGEEVTLDGSTSSADEGSTLTYAWARVPGKLFPSNIRGIDGPKARFSAEQEGDYYVSLVVDDGRRKAIGDPIMIHVVAGDKPPVIELDPTQKCNVKELIALDAKITDPQNYPLTIRWTCLDPKSLEIPPQFSNTARFRFAPQKAGTYLFQVEAKNTKGLSAVATTQIGVKDAAQSKPTAEITGPERAKVGDKVMLSAAKSYSPNNKLLSYRWADESEGGFKIKEPVPGNSKKEWTFKVTEPGRHVITMVVNDTVADSEPFKYYLDVAPAADPVADPRPPTPPIAPPARMIARISGPKTATAKTEVELSAEGSSGSVEGPLDYVWNQQKVDGGPDLGLTANQRRKKVLQFTPQVAGRYVFTLEVTDVDGKRSEPETYTVDVKPGQASVPIAVATLRSKDNSAPGKSVNLSAEKSTDPGGNGAPLIYKWTQLSGPPLVIAPNDHVMEIVVTPSKPGAYEMQVIVGNGETESAPSTVKFNVASVPLPMAIVAEITPPSIGDTVVLDGSGSKSPGGATGDQLQYIWKQKAGESLRLREGEDHKSKIQFVVPAEGNYTWELTVNDGNDWSEPTPFTFQVKPRGKNVAPITLVDRSVISTEVGVQTILDASASNDPDKGPEPLTFRWRRGNKALEEKGSIYKFTPPTAGALTFEVQCFDGKDWSEPVTVTVNVLPQGALPVAMPMVTDFNRKPLNPAVAKVSVRGQNNPDTIIVLDGTRSTPQKEGLAYTWKQTAGENLGLAAAVLAKERVGFRIYKAGLYKFELVVADGDVSSLPVTVEIKVTKDDE